MKRVKLKRYRIKDGYVLTAILRSGTTPQDVYDPRNSVVLLSGKDMRDLLSLFELLKKQKVKTPVNFYPFERVLKRLRKENGNADLDSDQSSSCNRKGRVQPSRTRTSLRDHRNGS